MELTIGTRLTNEESLPWGIPPFTQRHAKSYLLTYKDQTSIRMAMAIPTIEVTKGNRLDTE